MKITLGRLGPMPTKPHTPDFLRNHPDCKPVTASFSAFGNNYTTNPVQHDSVCALNTSFVILTGLIPKGKIADLFRRVIFRFKGTFADLQKRILFFSSWPRSDPEGSKTSQNRPCMESHKPKSTFKCHQNTRAEFIWRSETFSSWFRKRS